MTIRPFDPEAIPLLAADCAAIEARRAHTFKARAARADALREVAANTGDPAPFKQAAAIEAGILAEVELLQAYKRLVGQHVADNETAWAMIASQDERCARLKQHVTTLAADKSHWQGEYLRAWQRQVALQAQNTALVDALTGYLTQAPHPPPCAALAAALHPFLSQVQTLPPAPPYGH